MNDNEYSYLSKQVKTLTEVNLGNYEDNRMRRRLDSYITGLNYSNIYSFCRLIENDGDALIQLRDFIVFNHSEFFKDFWAYEELRARVLPQLCRRNHNLNVWSAGCSIGCEAYSLAMIMDGQPEKPSYTITATDINETGLQTARSGGPYTASDLKCCPDYLRRKYLKEMRRNSYVLDSLRQHIHFVKHDLLLDPYEADYDLIVCRDVSIHFSDAARGRLFKSLYGAIRESGVIFVGATEFITDFKALGLTKIGSCFYQKIVSKPASVMVSPLPVEISIS